MYKLFLKSIFFMIFCVIVLNFVGCISSTNDTEIIVKNSTNESVSIKKIEFIQNIELEPTETVVLHIDSNSEGFNLEVLWKGETYIGNTGYVQDSNKVTIELLENMNCKIIAHGKYSGGTHYTQLEIQ